MTWILSILPEITLLELLVEQPTYLSIRACKSWTPEQKRAEIRRLELERARAILRVVGKILEKSRVAP